MTEDDGAARRAELAALKAVVYGPDPPPEAIARLAALTGAEGAPPPAPAPAPPRARRPRRRVLVAALAAIAVLAGVGLAIRSAAPPDGRPSTSTLEVVPAPPPADTLQAEALRAEQAALRQVVLDHPEELSARDWFTVYPEELPGIWHSVVSAYPGLVGSDVLPIPLDATTTQVLVFLVCSAPDTPFRWTLTAGPAPPLADAAGGQCRGFDGQIVDVPAGTTSAVLRVLISPDVHYSVTVYER